MLPCSLLSGKAHAHTLGGNSQGDADAEQAMPEPPPTPMNGHPVELHKDVLEGRAGMGRLYGCIMNFPHRSVIRNKPS